MKSSRQSESPSEGTSTGERRALRAPRAPGPLDVSPDVRFAIASLLAFEAMSDEAAGRDREVDVRPVLSLEAVDALEDHLRARLPDDALALFASRTDALERFSLAEVGALTEQAWSEGLSKARVVLGPYGKHLVCIPRRPERGIGLRLTFFDLEDRTEGSPTSVAEWVVRLLEVASEEVFEDPEGGWEAVRRIASEIEWTPRLERTLVLPDPTVEKAGRKVRHARFGVGVVRRALPESDKLEIDFGDAGVKVLVARYVEEIS